MSEIQENKHMTIEEFDGIVHKDGFNYELIDGVVLMSPRPNYGHQRISGKLFRKLAIFFDNNPCEPFLETELKINNDILIPDISIICESVAADTTRYNKAPTLVVEIMSTSSRYVDMFVKLFKYEMLGVKEYWIIDPRNEMVTIYNFEIKSNVNFSKSEIIISNVFDSLKINASDIF